MGLDRWVNVAAALNAGSVEACFSAGDVGRFAYCPLNWKRSAEGEKGSGGEEGIRKHREASEQVDALESYQHRSRATLESSLYLALFAISGAALGVEVFILGRSTPWWWFLVLLSVLWMASSLYLFVFHRYYTGRARSLTQETPLAGAEVLYVDSPKHTQLFASRVLPLRGRPDYVLEREGEPVPVELKTGRTPKAPYDSHAMQLAAYCYLVQESTGKRPAHGILAYPDRQFEVPYTEALEDRLVKTLLRMELARRTGEAHRDHQNPGRCVGCSRREGCPERLA